MDKQRIIQQAQRNLARRTEALKATLEEIDLLESTAAPVQAILAARTKRDRQHNSVIAANALIDALKASVKKPK